MNPSPLSHLAAVVLGLASLSPCCPSRAGERAAFDAEAGNYGALILATGGKLAESGAVTVLLTAKGKLTGSLVWQGEKYALKGALDEMGDFTKTFDKKRGAIATLTLSLHLKTGTREMDATFHDTSADAPPTPATTTAAFILSGAEPDPVFGPQLEKTTRLSFIDALSVPIPGGAVGAASSVMDGHGFYLVRVGGSKSRAARFVGRMPDYDGAFSAGSVLRGPTYSFFRPLYKRSQTQVGGAAVPRFGGQILGDTGLAPNGVSLFWRLRWGLQPDPNSASFPDGFEAALGFGHTLYPQLKPGDNFPIDPAGRRRIPATIRLRYGSLAEDVSATIRISAFSTSVDGPNPQKIKMRANPVTATFTGTFIHPVTLVRTPFAGAFLPALGIVPGEGRGAFPGTGGSGAVNISIRP